MDCFQTESFWCHGFPHSLFPLMFLFQCFLNLWQPMSLNAAAKLLQSCPTLCNPIDGSPPGSPAPGILQARTLEWVAISFSNAWKWKVKVKSLSRVRLQRPHGLQPTRLLHPCDFPGKSTGVGCHCLLRKILEDYYIKTFLYKRPGRSGESRWWAQLPCDMDGPSCCCRWSRTQGSWWQLLGSVLCTPAPSALHAPRRGHLLQALLGHCSWFCRQSI